MLAITNSEPQLALLGYQTQRPFHQFNINMVSMLLWLKRLYYLTFHYSHDEPKYSWEITVLFPWWYQQNHWQKPVTCCYSSCYCMHPRNITCDGRKTCDNTSRDIMSVKKALANCWFAVLNCHFGAGLHFLKEAIFLSIVRLPLFCKVGSGTCIFEILVRALTTLDLHCPEHRPWKQKGCLFPPCFLSFSIYCLTP